MASLFSNGGQRGEYMEDQRGNVFVESLVAVAILVVAIVPAFSMFTLSPSIQTAARDQTIAMNIARSYAEYYHTLNQGDWNTQLPDNGTVTMPVPYTLPAGYQVTATSTKPVANLQLKYITVTVTWNDNRGNPNSVSIYTAVARRE